MIGGSTAIAVVVVRPLAYEVATLSALEEVPSLAGDGGVVLVGEGQQVVEVDRAPRFPIYTFRPVYSRRVV